MTSLAVIHTDVDQHPIDLKHRQQLDQLGVEVIPLVPRTREHFLKVGKRANAILNSDFRLTGDLIKQIEKCQIISRYGSGVDNIDVKTATSLGIPVANVPGFCEDAVADRTLLLLLACSSKLLTLDRYVRNGKWGLNGVPFAIELRGKTLGLVGFGRIGRAVADRARSFGLRVLAHDPGVEEDYICSRGAEPVALKNLLVGSDFISIHVPLNQHTKLLLNEARIALMKPSCFLINTARGGIVDEQALARALREGRLAGAGLDVFGKEPPSSCHPLFSLDNVVLTPHCAAHTREATTRVRQAAIGAVIAVFKNERPQNLVNPQAWGKCHHSQP